MDENFNLPDGVTADELPENQVCDVCNGSGALADWTSGETALCPRCGGNGRLWRIPRDARADPSCAEPDRSRAVEVVMKSWADIIARLGGIMVICAIGAVIALAILVAMMVGP